MLELARLFACFLAVGSIAVLSKCHAEPATSSVAPDLFQVEGRVIRSDRDRSTVPSTDGSWLGEARVVVTGAPTTVVGFVRSDGTFVVSNLASGSYVLEVSCARYVMEAVRVDISARGNVRARRLNHIQPADVSALPYPLKMRALGRVQYFMKREKWRITDVLLSPMVLMMVLPVLLIAVLPRVMSDPESKREMEQFQLPKYDMPELSEMMTSLFGADKQQKAAAAARNKKKQQ